MFTLRNPTADFLDVIFPRECNACKIALNKGEWHLCTRCLYRLPKTFTWKEKDNYVARLFWGRIYLENAASYLLFQKGSMVQEIIHQFKYKSQKETGFFLGQMFGNELKNTDFNDADIIVPVPLHKKKHKERGYNQSELLAQGIGKSMTKPVITNILKRTLANESQTRKQKYERWMNVERIFEVTQIIENQHILLVDDVLTTGATIESCAAELLKLPNIKLSVATLAVAV